jgi:hypothetical protein
MDRYEPRQLPPARFMLAAASVFPAFGSGIVVSWLYTVEEL